MTDPSIPPATILRLAAEMLRNIFCNLDKNDLNSIAHVSVNFAEAAQACVYKTVNISEAKTVQLRFRTLRHHPKLARYVQHFQTDESALKGSDCPDSTQPGAHVWMLTTTDQGLADKFLAAQGINDPAFPQQSDHVEVRIGLFLSLCSNLKTFCRSYATSRFHSPAATTFAESCATRLRTRLTDVLGALDDVHTVHVGGDNLAAFEIIPLFYLQKV